MDTYMTNAGKYPIPAEQIENVVNAIDQEVDSIISELGFKNGRIPTSPYFPITLNTPAGIIMRGYVVNNGIAEKRTLAEIKHENGGLVLIIEKQTENYTPMKGIHSIGQKFMSIN